MIRDIGLDVEAGIIGSERGARSRGRSGEESTRTRAAGRSPPPSASPKHRDTDQMSSNGRPAAAAAHRSEAVFEKDVNPGGVEPRRVDIERIRLVQPVACTVLLLPDGCGPMTVIARTWEAGESHRCGLYPACMCQAAGGPAVSAGDQVSRSAGRICLVAVEGHLPDREARILRLRPEDVRRYC
jgi:hypothetical protein